MMAFGKSKPTEDQLGQSILFVPQVRAEFDFLVLCPDVKMISPVVFKFFSGLWARDACKPLGMDLRLVMVDHQYAVTKGIPSVKNMKLPVIQDPDDRYYVRQLE